jgi:hypothetical protein
MGKALSFEVSPREQVAFSSLATTDLHGSPEAITSASFAAGESPFKVKGVALRGVFPLYEEILPGGVPALLARLDDRALASYMSQQFIANETYDVFAFAKLGITAAELAGVPYNVFTFRLAERQAELDLSGVYKLILRALSPIQVINRIVRVGEIYFNFAPASARVIDAHTAEFTRQEFPLALMPWYGPVVEGYNRVALARTGARDITSQIALEPSPQLVHGLPVATLRIRMQWR